MLRSLLLLSLAAAPALAAQEDITALVRSLPTEGRVIAVGESRDGRLSGQDVRAFGDGPPLQAWTIRPAAGQTVTIDLLSDEFDPVLLVVGPGMIEPLRNDDGAGGCNSRITHTFNGGEYRVVISAFAWGFGDPGAGAFTLRASTDPPPMDDAPCSFADDLGFDDSWVDVTIETLNALPLAGRLRRGDSTTAMLNEAAGEIGGGRRGLAYEVSGPPGGAVTIDLASTAFDTYLFVVHPNHAEPLSDDDAGGACNSRLAITLPESGRVRVVASSFGSGAEGRFTLGAYRDAPPARQGACGATSRFDASAVAGLPSSGRTGAGRSHDGELSPDDAQLDTYYADVWELTGTSGERVVIDLVSPEFDAYLGLTGPGIVGAMTDDDSGGRCNSRLDVVLPEAGTYRIVATSFRNAATGRYTLTVGREAGPPQEGGCSFPRESASRLRGLPIHGTLEPDGTVDGRLEGSQPMLSGGMFAEAWTLEVRAGQVYVIEMHSDAFDTYLFAVAPDGLAMDDDDCGSGTDSRLVVRPGRSGQWRVVASSFTAAEGPYTLTVRTGEPALECGEAPDWVDDGVDYDEAPVIGRVQVGDEYRGTLTREDARHYDGSRLQAFDLSARAGTRITVDLLSDTFDAYLIIMGRGLDEMLTDDDSGGACNSRITFTVPESGTYRIVVNTLLGGEYGPYILRVSAVEGPLTPGDCEPL